MSDQLTIGDRPVTVPVINGFKAVRAGRLVAEAAEVLPEVQAKIAEVRANTPPLEITPDVAKLPRFQRTVRGADGEVVEEPIWSEADFAEAGGTIKIAQDPSSQDVALAVFPTVFKAAEKQVVELLAMLITPNSTLREQDEAGDVDSYLEREGQKLLHEASLDQLIQLLIVAVSQVAEALASDVGDALEAVRAVATGEAPAPAPQTSTEGTTPSMPESPTASPAPTGGPEQTVSTSPPGEKSGSLSSG